MSGPKLKKSKASNRNFHEMDSKAFSKSISNSNPGIYLSWVYCRTSYIIRVFPPINLPLKKLAGNADANATYPDADPGAT